MLTCTIKPCVIVLSRHKKTPEASNFKRFLCFVIENILLSKARYSGSSAFLMGKFIQSSRNPLNPSKVFEKATHY